MQNSFNSQAEKSGGENMPDFRLFTTGVGIILFVNKFSGFTIYNNTSRIWVE